MKKLSILVFAALLFALCSTARAAEVKLFVSPDAKPCVRHGAGVLESKLKAAGLDVRRVAELKPGDTGAIEIVDLSAAPGGPDTDVPKQAESYAIRNSNGRITGAGRDSIGAMYAAYDIAEQLEIMKPPSLAAVESRSRAPFNEIRAVNPFFHVDAFNDPKSWFYDEEYWKTYLDELSIDRYNLLDIHAMYELISTFFPNCYLYLLKSDKYPKVGVSAAQAEKNLKMFNRIIDLADERGIRVSLMSYHASWRKTDKDPEAIEPGDKELAEYTAEMVQKIIDKCPKLWMIGFRIGESGRSDDFFKESYIEGINKASRKVMLFTRTWLATPVQVLNIVDAYPNQTLVEIKYNGEQLGLPYHAMTTRRRDTAASYTYETYSNWPRKYKILWQIRANGTHRLFRWGDPAFASRTMRSVQFASGAGFTMEPMTSYYPPTDFFFKPEMKFNFFKWDHQRNWFWYMVWGRNAYNPDEPRQVWLNRFEQHFGPGGADALEMISQMSRIVPLIYSWRCLGPDHRNMAPEFETGGDLNAFTKNFPLDPEAIASIDEFTNHYLYNDPLLYGKLGPFDAADLLDAYVAAARDAQTRAAKNIDPSNVEFKSLSAEFDTLQHLALYYSAKIRAATYLSFFQKKNTYPELKLAEKYTRDAISEWGELSKTGNKYFGQILDTLRIRKQVGKNTFTWGELASQLDADLKIIEEENKHFSASAAKKREGLAVYHIPSFNAPEGAPLKVSATILGAPADAQTSASVFYRPEGSDYEYKQVPMSRENGGPTFVADIPAGDAHGSLEYFIGAEAGDLKGRYPGKYSAAAVKTHTFTAEEYADGTAKKLTRELDKLADFEKRKISTVRFSSDSTPPAFSNVEVNVSPTGNHADITVSIDDQSKIEKVVMYYKPIPSTYFWSEIEMQPAGGNKFKAGVNLTPEGLLYYFHAGDSAHNAAAYPNFLDKTPYLVIDSWDPAINPYSR